MANRQYAEKPEDIKKLGRKKREPKVAGTLKKYSSKTDQENAFSSLKDRKWSLPDAILLHGTLEHIHQWAPSTPGEIEWTHCNLESQQALYLKKFDAPTRSSLQKLFMAFTILETAAHKLDLTGTAGASGQTFREAVGYLLKFVSANDGLRIKGISSGASSLSKFDTAGSRIALSMFGAGHEGFAPSSKCKSPLAAEVHRLKQHAALGSAILYLAAKRTGVGRTLTEVCSAFGTYKIIASNNAMGGGEGGESLVRPKYCSKAMQEFRTALPEVMPPAGGGALPAVASMSSDVPVNGEQIAAKVTPTYSATSMEESPYPVKSEYTPDGENTKSSGINGNDSTHIATNLEEAALADLVSRMGSSLNLPPCAITAATAVAIQCTRDVTASTLTKASPSKRSAGSAHIRPRKRKAKGSNKDAPDVIAVSSILLVCMAGGTMQRLAPQALSKAASLMQAEKEHHESAGMAKTSTAMSNLAMSNPLDDLHDDLSSSSPVKPDSIGSNNEPTSTTHNTSIPIQSNNNNSKPNALSTWAAWNDQPPWHREVSTMEQCTGVPCKALISYYSTVVHPRRSYFLGVAVKKEDGNTSSAGFLHNIVAAVPLMSLRNL